VVLVGRLSPHNLTNGLGYRTQRLKSRNFRALTDERSHDLSRKDDQANSDAGL
jgi:hypothetical protein